MNFRMIQAVIKCSERSTVARIEENSNDVSRCLFMKYTTQAKILTRSNVLVRVKKKMEWQPLFRTFLK